MPKALHSRAVEDYLKAIYKLGGDSEAVATSALAEELSRTAASVTNMVKGLADRGLLEHTPYHGARLTETGRSAALRIIRRHRILETYLIERLGFGWDTVHEEAERLEHAASAALIESMAIALGNPDVDPHGAPIPSQEGRIASRLLESLADLPPGAGAVIREVPDEDPDRLRLLSSKGLLIGTPVVVVRAVPAGSSDEILVSVSGTSTEVGADLARLIQVERTIEK
ncbi:MAG: metal-dependent transcriptional regulator [Gemmatimonadota bacterium]